MLILLTWTLLEIQILNDGKKYITIYYALILDYFLDMRLLKEDLDNGIDFDYLDNSNVIFIILREYI